LDFRELVYAFGIRDPRPKPACTAAYAPDGKLILICDKTRVHRWDAQTGAALPPLEPGEPLSYLALSPDGTTVLTGGGSGVRLWQAATGRPLEPPLRPPDAITQAAFSRDGRILLTRSPSTLRLWEAATRRPLGPGVVPPREGFAAVAHSPDCRTVLTVSENKSAPEQVVGLWDLTTGRFRALPFAFVRGQSGIAHVAFSPDGKTALTSGTDAARVWDAATGRLLGFPLPFEEKGHWAAGYTPDGTALVTQELFEARVWPMPTAPVKDAAHLLLWTQVATGRALDADGQVRLLDARSWQQCRDRLNRIE
jgi:WD40 repeat protein